MSRTPHLDKIVRLSSSSAAKQPRSKTGEWVSGGGTRPGNVAGSGAKVYTHPQGSTIIVDRYGSVTKLGPDGKQRPTSATAAKLEAGHGKWKKSSDAAVAATDSAFKAKSESAVDTKQRSWEELMGVNEPGGSHRATITGSDAVAASLSKPVRAEDWRGGGLPEFLEIQRGSGPLKFDNARFIRSHGKNPKATGEWMFEHEASGLRMATNASLTNARNAVRKTGLRGTVHVLP